MESYSKFTLNIETHFLFITEKLNQLTCKSALRITTMPIYKQIIECRSKKSIQIKTNLEVLLNTIQKQTGPKPKENETSTPFLIPSWLAYLQSQFYLQKIL